MKQTKLSLIALAVASAYSHGVLAENAAAEEAVEIDEIVTVGEKLTYANNIANESMAEQQAALTSVLAVIDNLPGVLINEGDAFGADDWSTSINIRGFQLDLGQQQIGMTIDGIANGNSNYGGGAKANRFIDTENLGVVSVAQGTSGITSRSNEALGGTINFTTIDPSEQHSVLASVTLAEFDGQKFFARLNTGEIFDNTYAWLSISNQSSSDWMDQAAENSRDHFAAKIKSYQDNVEITGYFSYDDTHEDNYQRVSKAGFAQNDEWDQLTDTWTGIPYVDQAYRRGWSTLRENIFGYLQADWSISANANLVANIYYHDNEGRGDWVPPYIVEVTNNGAGNPNTELLPQTVNGGPFLGQIFFVDSNGVALSPADGCVSSLTFPYGGGAAQYDPACYPDNAIPVGSYRHTHYEKQRVGINLDYEWMTQIAGFNNTVRAGLWYEDYDRSEYRDWHKIIDSRTSYRFDHTPYWIQYNREFPVETLMYYLQNEIDFGSAIVTAGIKQFNVDVAKKDLFDSDNDLDVTSDSDALFSLGVVVPFANDYEFYAGYSENYAAIKDSVLERNDTDLRFVKPETADNFDIGLRIFKQDLTASFTYYDIKFNDRIEFVSNETSEGIDFLEEAAGGYRNRGGVESSGFEVSVEYDLNQAWSLFSSLTLNDSTYTDEDLAGYTVLGTAEQMGVISVDWQGEVSRAGLSFKHVGERPIESSPSGDKTTQEMVDAYNVVDLYLGTTRDLGDTSLDIRFTINNLLDERYLGTIAEGAAWIGAPRTAAVNVAFEF